MSQRKERPFRPDEVIDIIDTRTLQVQGQEATVFKIRKTNIIPRGFTILGQACPDDDCMMAFYEEGPGNTERAIAQHRLLLPEQTEMKNSNTKWAGADIVMEGMNPWFTRAQYNKALARSEQAEQRKRAKELEKSN